MNKYEKEVALVKELVEKESDPDDWKYHILLVTELARILAHKLGVNAEIVQLGALLHDIGRIRGNDNGHEEHGALEAEKILHKLGLPDYIVEIVKECVTGHRSGATYDSKDSFVRIVRNADALAHFYTVPWLIKVALELHNGDVALSCNWVREKLERDLRYKIDLDLLREGAFRKYQAALKILENPELALTLGW